MDLELILVKLQHIGIFRSVKKMRGYSECIIRGYSECIGALAAPGDLRKR